MSDNLDVKRVDESNLSCLLYMMSFIWVFPLSHIILPLILWLLLKNKYKNLELHGKNLLNFQITWGLVVVTLWLMLLFSPFGRYFFFGVNFSVILPVVVVMVAAVFTIIGAVIASRGKLYQFPLTHQFIK